MEDKIIRQLASVTGAENIRMNESMSSHTTFRIGGPADVFIAPRDVRSLCAALEVLRQNDVPYFILGNGSNLLVSDAGFRGAVVHIDRDLQVFDSSDSGCSVAKEAVGYGIIRAGAGVLLSKIAAEARDRSLTGLEFASGIPGTLGGACVMNAGAYGGEMKNVLTCVTVLDEDFNVRKISASELGLGYRTSRIQTEQWIVLGAEIALAHGDKEQINAQMEDLKEKRTTKQPLEYPSAGSTFKRPEGYFAGKLIDDAGLRGFTVGGAQVSEKHCGFVINRGGATAADVRELIRRVQDRVYEKSGVWLEPEIRMLGFDD